MTLTNTNVRMQALTNITYVHTYARTHTWIHTHTHTLTHNRKHAGRNSVLLTVYNCEGLHLCVVAEPPVGGDCQVRWHTQLNQDIQ